MQFVAAITLLMILMALAIVQIVAAAAFASGDHPEIPADRRGLVLPSMAFYVAVGLGLFVLAGARFAELMFG